MIKTRTKLIISAIILAIIGGVVSGTVYSAFSATTTNGANSYASGTVTLTDSDSGSAFFALTNMKPADTSTKCIKVDYSGSLTSTVKLYHALSGGTLGQYLTLLVERGTFPGAAPASNACTGFSATSTIYNGNMSSFPTTYGGGLDQGTWTNGTSAAYRVTVTLQDVNAAKGDSASETFTWEAQNQ